MDAVRADVIAGEAPNIWLHRHIASHHAILLGGVETPRLRDWGRPSTAHCAGEVENQYPAHQPPRFNRIKAIRALLSPAVENRARWPAEFGGAPGLDATIPLMAPQAAAMPTAWT